MLATIRVLDGESVYASSKEIESATGKAPPADAAYGERLILKSPDKSAIVFFRNAKDWTVCVAQDTNEDIANLQAELSRRRAAGREDAPA